MRGCRVWLGGIAIPSRSNQEQITAGCEVGDAAATPDYLGLDTIAVSYTVPKE